MRVIKNIGKSVGALLLMVIIWFVALISFGTYEEIYTCEGTYISGIERQGRTSAEAESRTAYIKIKFGRFFNPIFYQRGPRLYIEIGNWETNTFADIYENHIGFIELYEKSRRSGILSKVSGRLSMSSTTESSSENSLFSKQSYLGVCKNI